MHRSRSQEKPHRVYGPMPATSCDSRFDKPHLAEGYFQYRNLKSASRLEFNLDSAFALQTDATSISLGTKSNSSINALLAKEMPIKKHTTRPSPGVIARLMGLDSLPSFGPPKPQKEVNLDDSLLKKSKDESHEFKDVFEVIDVQKVEKRKNHITHKGMESSNVGEIDLAFVRQSFINVKHLSTDEKLQRSKEFDDALEVLDSNKYFFLKLLQEPQSLFSKHLQDLPYSPLSQHASHASVLSQSRAIQSASFQSSLRLEENAGRYTNMQRRKSQSFSKRVDKLPSLPSRKHMCSLPEKLSNSMCGGKGEARAHPSEIVIMKPGPAKTGNAERGFTSAYFVNNSTGNAERGFTSAYFVNNSKHRVINHREPLKDEFMELNDEEGCQKKSCEVLEPTRYRTKAITEISKVTRRSALGNGRKVSVSNYSYYDKDEDLAINLAKINKTQSSYWTTGNNNEFGSNFSKQSCPIEPAVCRDSSRCESEQCMVTHHFEEFGLSSRTSNTLGEMLALSDKETFKRTLDTSSVRKTCPLGISSRDGWKDGFSGNLTNFKHLPASSIVYGDFQHNDGNKIGSSRSRFKPKSLHDLSNEMGAYEVLVREKGTFHDDNVKLSYGGDDRIPMRDVHVNAENVQNRALVGPLAEERLITRKLSDNYSTNMVDGIYIPQFISGESSSVADLGCEKLIEITKSEDNRKQVSCNHREILPKEASADHSENVLLPSHFTPPFMVSPDNYKESGQPSPVSVLEMSPKKGKSPLGCFKRISADLEELQLQLQLLKLESSQSVLEEIDADACGDLIPHLGEIQQALRDEEDRDYAYLLDMLIDSVVLKADESKLFGACHLIEHSASPNVFDKLEKKYRSLGSWSRLERKLLFDLVNCTLEEISATSYETMCPWFEPRISSPTRMAREGLVEELWQAVAKRRKGLLKPSEDILVGSNWLNTQNNAEVVSNELENMLHADLIAELLAELMSISSEVGCFVFRSIVAFD